MKKGRIIHYGGFGYVTKAIMRDRGLSGPAKLIYCYLASFAGSTGKAWPGVSLMTAELGMTKNTFYKYLKELKESGALRVEKQKNPDGTFAGNVYYLEDQTREKKEDTAPCTKKPHTVQPDTVQPDTVNKDTISNSSKSNSIISNSSNKSEQSSYDEMTLDVANTMIQIMTDIKPDSRIPRNLKTWTQYIDYMIRLDKRTPNQIIELFRWAQNDSFWVANIRSPRKLREKWDTLDLQRNRNQGKDNISTLRRKFVEAQREEEGGLFD